MNNKYSSYKIVWHPDKLQAMRERRITPPIYVRVKPTNRCNHRCQWCVYHQTVSTMHDGMDVRDELSEARLLSLTAELATAGVQCLTWTGGGEPLLHPAIVRANVRCRELGIATSLITNGQLLTGLKAEAFRDCSWVRVSVDYWDAASFEQSGRGNARAFAVIEDNLKTFAQLIRRQDTSPDFGVNAIVTKENHNHLYMMAHWLKGLGVDNIRFSPVWTDDFFNYHYPLLSAVRYEIQYSRENLSNKTFQVYDSYSLNESQNRRNNHRCYWQEINPVIAADGNVYRCKDQSYTEAGLLGSIKDQSFQAMWQAPKTQERIHNFDPRQRCQNIQCAAYSKNALIEQFMDASTDSFV